VQQQGSVNPDQTEMILFARKYKPAAIYPITFYCKELELASNEC